MSTPRSRSTRARSSAAHPSHRVRTNWSRLAAPPSSTVPRWMPGSARRAPSWQERSRFGVGSSPRPGRCWARPVWMRTGAVTRSGCSNSSAVARRRRAWCAASSWWRLSPTRCTTTGWMRGAGQICASLAGGSNSTGTMRRLTCRNARGRVARLPQRGRRHLVAATVVNAVPCVRLVNSAHHVVFRGGSTSGRCTRSVAADGPGARIIVAEDWRLLCHRIGWPTPRRFPSLPRNHAARSPLAPVGG